MTPKEVLDLAKKHEAKQVDLRFADIPGLSHHISYPISELEEKSFEEGFGIDGSSIRGWAAINESDMLLVPDASRFWIDPFTEETTLCLIANVMEPITKDGYRFDPRSVAVRAESYLKFTGIADTVNVGPEAEFFVFDQATFHNEQYSAGFTVNSEEGHWNSGRDGGEVVNNGYQTLAALIADAIRLNLIC